MKDSDKKKRSIGTDAKIKSTSQWIQLAKESPAKTILLGLATGIFFKKLLTPASLPSVEQEQDQSQSQSQSHISQSVDAGKVIDPADATLNLWGASAPPDDLQHLFAARGSVFSLPEATASGVLQGQEGPTQPTLMASRPQSVKFGVDPVTVAVGRAEAESFTVEVSNVVNEWVDATPRPLDYLTAETPWTDSALSLFGLLAGGGGVVGEVAASLLTAAGVVVDGHIVDAMVYRVDANGQRIGNYVFTDANGNYSGLATGDASTKIVVQALTNYVDPLTGITHNSYDKDLSPGNQVAFTSALTLYAPGNATVVNPITTLIQSLKEQDPTLTLDGATQLVVKGLGLPAGVSYLNFDPLTSSSTVSAADALAVQKAASQIALLVTSASSSAAASAAEFGAKSAQVMNLLATALKGYEGSTHYDAQKTVLTNGDALVSAFASIATADLNSALSASAQLNQQIVSVDSIDKVFATQVIMQSMAVLGPMTGGTISSVLSVFTSAYSLQSTPEISLTEGDVAMGGVLSSSTSNPADWSYDASAAKGTYGEFKVSKSGQWTFTTNGPHHELAQGEVVYQSLKVTDVSAKTYTTLTVKITGTNDIPVVKDVSATLTEKSSIHLTADYSDADATDVCVVTVDTTSTKGKVTNQNGTFIYDTNHQFDHLAEGAYEVDSFRYTVNDGHGGLVTRTVTLTVKGVNDAAVIQGSHTGNVTEDGQTLEASGQLIVTDVDDGQSKVQSVDVARLSSKGVGHYTVSANGQWIYQLDNANTTVQSLGQDQTLVDTFDVVSADGSTTQTVAITIKGQNDPAVVTPTAIDMTVNETQTPLVLKGKFNISDVDVGEAKFIAATYTPNHAHGTLTVAVNGDWTFTSNQAYSDFAGEAFTDTFEVQTQDGTLQTALSLHVGVALGVATSTANLFETNAALTVSGRLVIPDRSDTVFLPVTGYPTAHGTFSVGADGGWTFVASSAYDELAVGQSYADTYELKNVSGVVIGQIHVVINGTNDSPVIQATGQVLSDSVQEDIKLVASGYLNVTDVDQTGALNWRVDHTQGAYGTLTLGSAQANQPQTWTYTLNTNSAAVQALAADELHDENFVVTTTDSQGASVSQVLTIHVRGTNDVPVISGTATGAVQEDVGAGVAVGQLSASDPDLGATQVWTVDHVQGVYGSFELNATTGGWTYRLNNLSTAVQSLAQDESHDETFTVRVTDDKGAYVDQAVKVTVSGTNDAPQITNLNTALLGAVKEDTAGQDVATGQLRASDVDVLEVSQTWSVQGSGAGVYGALTVNASTGLWTYRLNNASTAVQSLAKDESHVETFTVRVTDDKGAYVDQAVKVTVTGTNDAPQITNLNTALLGAVKEDTAGQDVATGQLSASDVDVLGVTQTWSVQGSAAGVYGTLAVNASTGLWTYHLNNGSEVVQRLAQNESHVETFTVRVTDDKGAYADQSVKVTVSGTNDTPTITNTLVSGDIKVSIQQGTPVPIHSTYLDGDKNASLFLAQLLGADVDMGAQLHYEFGTHTSKNADYSHFYIDPSNGYITLTMHGAEDIAAEPDVTKTDYYLNVRVVDENGAYTEQEVDLHVNRAVSSDGKSATLPGAMADWDVQPVVGVDSGLGDGFLLKSRIDPAITITLPSTVTTLTFTDGSTLNLHNAGTDAFAVMTDTNASSTVTHQLSVAQGTLESVEIDVSGYGDYTVIGASDSVSDPALGTVEGFRSDTIKVDVNFDQATFTILTGDLSTSATHQNNCHIHVDINKANSTEKIGTLNIDDIEYIQFKDKKVTLIGADLPPASDTVIDVDAQGNYVIIGSADKLNAADNARSDTVRVNLQDATMPVTSFVTTIDGNVQMVWKDNTANHNILGTALLREVEKVQFVYNDGNTVQTLESILIVAGGGYASLTQAEAHNNLSNANTFIYNPSSTHGNDVYHY